MFLIFGQVYDLPVIFFLIYLSDCCYLIRIAESAAESEGYRRRQRHRRWGGSEDVMCCDRSDRCDKRSWTTDATMEKISRFRWLETRATLISMPKSSFYLFDRDLERVGGKYKTKATILWIFGTWVNRKPDKQGNRSYKPYRTMPFPASTPLPLFPGR